MYTGLIHDSLNANLMFILALFNGVKYTINYTYESRQIEL